jgi:hypothetical protein
MAKKSKLNPFTGRWRIVSMSAWKDEGLNEEGQAFIEFDEEGVGKFQFGNVQGLTDHYRSKKRDGKRLAQFSWDGEGVDGMPLEGIGWVILEGGEMSGTISIYLGDDLQFVAKRAQQHRVGGDEGS